MMKNPGNKAKTVILEDDHSDIRDAVRKLCEQFPNEYWRRLDRELAYPTRFVRALSDAGYLSNQILSCVATHEPGMPRSF